jgi:hypothetical protein
MLTVTLIRAVNFIKVGQIIMKLPLATPLAKHTYLLQE